MVTSFSKQLNSHQLIGIDTSIFIYHFEANSRYLALTQQLLNAVEMGQCHAVTSMITLMELTVRPWHLQKADVARKYEILLANFPNLRLLDVTKDVARQAAQLRATYHVQSADALQIATAMVNKASLWVSNDKKLKQLHHEIEIIVLEDYI